MLLWEGGDRESTWGCWDELSKGWLVNQETLWPQICMVLRNITHLLSPCKSLFCVSGQSSQGRDITHGNSH